MTATRSPRRKSKPSQRVVVVKTLMDGSEERRIMSPFAAALELHSPQNGVTVRSLRIEFGRVIDRYGMSV